MENIFFGRVTKDRKIIEHQHPDVVSPKPDGGTLVVVSCVVVSKQALTNFTTLSPVGSPMSRERGKRGPNQVTKERLQGAKKMSLLKEVKEGDD